MSETTYSVSDCDYLNYPFLNNKYRDCYIRIIRRCLRYPIKKIRGYTETHHILPTSLGGINEKNNKVVLTTKEHFIAHALLIRCTQGQDRYRMLCAMDRMCTPSPTMTSHQQNARIGFRSSLIYVASRREFSKSLGDKRRGQKQSPESNEKRRLTQSGRKLNPTWIENIRKGMTGIVRGPQSIEHIEKRSAARRGKPRGKYNIADRSKYDRPELMKKLVNINSSLAMSWREAGNSGKYPAGWKPEGWSLNV